MMTDVWSWCRWRWDGQDDADDDHDGWVEDQFVSPGAWETGQIWYFAFSRFSTIDIPTGYYPYHIFCLLLLQQSNVTKSCKKTNNCLETGESAVLWFCFIIFGHWQGYYQSPHCQNPHWKFKIPTITNQNEVKISNQNPP